MCESERVALKEFTFKHNDEESEESLSVTVPEALDPQYGMYVWPCAVVLAQFVWSHRQELRDASILELGAGVSLPGVVAARCGAAVILSDCADKPQCLRNCLRSCQSNGLQEVQVRGLNWGHVSPALVSLPKVDLILGSDVFYDPQDFASVLVTVAFLFRKNPQAQFWTTYQVRSSDCSIEPHLRRWRMRCELISLDQFEADGPDVGGSCLPGNHSIQMLVIAPDDRLQVSTATAQSRSPR